MKAWGALDFIRFGPIMNEHRLERFYFWPDPRGTTARQLAKLLAKRDPAVLTPKILPSRAWQFRASRRSKS